MNRYTFCLSQNSRTPGSILAIFIFIFLILYKRFFGMKFVIRKKKMHRKLLSFRLTVSKTEQRLLGQLLNKC